MTAPADQEAKETVERATCRGFIGQNSEISSLLVRVRVPLTSMIFTRSPKTEHARGYNKHEPVLETMVGVLSQVKLKEPERSRTSLSHSFVLLQAPVSTGAAPEFEFHQCVPGTCKHSWLSGAPCLQ
jgi:hypothetical protein